MVRTHDVPSRIASQVSATVPPTGLVAPRPVTTMRSSLLGVIGGSAPCVQGVRGHGCGPVSTAYGGRLSAAYGGRLDACAGSRLPTMQVRLALARGNRSGHHAPQRTDRVRPARRR